jgi:hypothetical protein
MATVTFLEELKAAEQALKALQDKCAKAPVEDWRALIGWEAVEAAQKALEYGMFDALCLSKEQLRPTGGKNDAGTTPRRSEKLAASVLAH